MTKKLVLLGAYFLISSVSFSQENSTLERSITDKEFTLENSINSSRQINNSVKAELLELYLQYKIELEDEIETISDETLKIKKSEELNDLNSKIANISQKK